MVMNNSTINTDNSNYSGNNIELTDIRTENELLYNNH